MNLVLENVEVVQVSDVEQKGANGFEVRHVAVINNENPQYPQYHKVNFNGDKADLLDKIEEGDVVTIHVNVNGRKWTDRAGVDQFFNSLDGWKIKKAKSEHEEKAATPAYAAPATDLSDASDDDDLPF